MASRRAFVISVAPNSTVSVPLLYASHCSSICVRPRENKDEEDHSFSEAAMFREFNMKMMHAMPSSSGVARDCRPFHVSTSIRREKLRSHIVLSAPIVLRNVLPVDISYSLRSTKSVSSKSFRPDEAKRLAASLECPHVTGIIKPGQIIHIHSVRLDSDPLLSFRCMWFDWSQEISVLLPRKRRKSSKDSDGDPNDEILTCHDNRSKRHLPNTSPLLLHLRRQEDKIKGRHRFVIYAPYWVQDRTGLGLIYGICSAKFKSKDKAKREKRVRHVHAAALQNHSIVEELFQNQRRSVSDKKKWTKPWLPNDRPEWTDASGRVSVRREDVLLPNKEYWRWDSDWTLDVLYVVFEREAREYHACRSMA